MLSKPLPNKPRVSLSFDLSLDFSPFSAKNSRIHNPVLVGSPTQLRRRRGMEKHEDVTATIMEIVRSRAKARDEIGLPKIKINRNSQCAFSETYRAHTSLECEGSSLGFSLKADEVGGFLRGSSPCKTLRVQLPQAGKELPPLCRPRVVE
jgi:hypothetical protein